MRSNTITLLFALLLLCFSDRSFAADFVVITHANNGVDKMGKNEIINIYMGRNIRMPNGVRAIPIDLASSTKNKSSFYMFMMEKELAEINSYWARLKFSGQGNAPVQMDNAEDVLEFVSRNKGALAYLDKTKVDKRVKVVFDPTH